MEWKTIRILPCLQSAIEMFFRQLAMQIYSYVVKRKLTTGLARAIDSEYD